MIHNYLPKFDYHSCPREVINGSRHYVTPDGKKLPSVTTILDITKPEENRRAIREWQQRIGVEKAKAITTQAANRGTKLHTYLENWVRNGSIGQKPGNPFHLASYQMADSVVQQGLVNCQEFWGVEVPLYFPTVYAGTTDCVGIHESCESIIDFKQTNKAKKREWIDDYFLQLCAYAEAHNEIHNTHIRKGVIMMCIKPKEDDNGMPAEPPIYQEFILEGTEFEKYRSLWWHRVEQYYKLLS